MNLWIKSQDKKSLRIVSNINIIHEDDKFFICNYTGIANIKLGTYKTEQRALEVLDEIQKKINMINLGHDFGSPMIDLNNPTYIYEMPKE